MNTLACLCRGFYTLVLVIPPKGHDKTRRLSKLNSTNTFNSLLQNEFELLYISSGDMCGVLREKREVARTMLTL